ncbi:hypothetical protein [Glycomyces rhizosphaerae]|uniref:Uncharacterized protein n=1 Tax=Glycomyces rhizosphaerae TaxID=2054422 RepID=A0ABV7PUH0_9ACTN
MDTFLIILLLGAILAGLGWYMYKHVTDADGTVPFQGFGSEAGDASPPPPRPKPMAVTLTLPSRDAGFVFTCEFTATYTPSYGGMDHLEPPRSNVESLLYTVAKDISSRFTLLDFEQVRSELHNAFQTERQLPGQNFRISADCKKIRVSEDQVATLKYIHDEDVEIAKLQRRIAFFNTVFENPRNATMWWLAKHEDQIDQLPQKAELIYRLDQRLNPENNQSEVPVSRDLDWFLEGADEAQKATIGVALAGIYRKYGRDDLAAEAERLIPSHTLPTRNGSRPETSDPDIPSAPFGQ